VTSGNQAPETVERLLRSLPGWFGIESSVIEYVAAAAHLPTYLARPRESGPGGEGWRGGEGPPGGEGLPALPGSIPGSTPVCPGRSEDPPRAEGWPGGVGRPVGAGRTLGAGPAVGVLLAARHFPGAAEIHLMAVDPAAHRRGVGRALVSALERDLAADHVRLLQVKTLGPSAPDPGYRKTRQFYGAMGFAPLEEITGLWPGNPCLIMVKVLC